VSNHFIRGFKCVSTFVQVQCGQRDLREGSHPNCKNLSNVDPDLETLKLTSCSPLYRLALCQAQDDELLKETYNIILNGARDQDVIYFFAGLAGNKKSKMEVIDFFKKNYDGVAFILISFSLHDSRISLFSCTNDSKILSHSNIWLRCGTTCEYQY
jgi:hypothetical protein